MPTRDTNAPDHADTTPGRTRKRRLPKAFLMLGLAAVATAVPVSVGLAGSDHALPAAAASDVATHPQVTAAILADRTASLSRSADRRSAVDPRKAAALSDQGGRATTKTVNDKPTDPRQLAQELMPQYGLDPGQFSCLDSLWTKESGWNKSANNPSSGAYGIPQSLPGSKMATIAPDWATNAETQIRWGLTYIKSSYGSACNAWAHSESYNWY